MSSPNSTSRLLLREILPRIVGKKREVKVLVQAEHPHWPHEEEIRFKGLRLGTARGDQAVPVRCVRLWDNQQRCHRLVTHAWLLFSAAAAARGRNRVVGNLAQKVGLWSQDGELPTQYPLLQGLRPKASWEAFRFKYQPVSPQTLSHLLANIVHMQDEAHTNKAIALFSWLAVG